ncbi:MAG: hypothetical protein PHQ40_12120 [Anaerolineaceae bacterium]|nr:hypothetical protein [Anaerolineaceae bacterium]
MIAALISFPLFVILVMLQSVLVSRIPLLFGTADVVMLTLAAWALNDRVTTAWFWALVGGLMVSLVSGVPGFVPLVGYLLLTGIARLLRKSIWQTPILTMLLVAFVGTLVTQGLTVAALQFKGVGMPLQTVINQVTLPSVLLNLLLAIPVYALVNDLANSLYPSEVES